MNVFMVGKNWNTPRGGGLDRYFVDLTRHLDQAGAKPIALVHDVGTDPIQHVYGFGKAGDNVVSRALAARRMGKHLLQSNDVNLINLHFALYSLPLLDVFGSDRPIVCNFHGPWATESQVEEDHDTVRQRLSTWVRVRAKRTIEQTVYGRSHRFIVLSSAFRQILHQEYGVPQELITVIPGGVDIHRFQPVCSRWEARRRLGWPKDRPLIVAVRRLVRRMGLENLVDAMDTVRRRCPDALLLIGGRGVLETELRSRIAERGLEHHVRLVGFIPDDHLPLAYRAADFSVVPTVALEGFGLILTESLACGTPSLGTPVGGIPEVLRPLHESLLFESPEPAALADRITEVLAGRVVLPSQQACRDYAVDNFAWNHVTRQVLNVFREAQGGVSHDTRAVSGS